MGWGCVALNYNRGLNPTFEGSSLCPAQFMVVNVAPAAESFSTRCAAVCLFGVELSPSDFLKGLKKTLQLTGQRRR